MSIQKTLQVSKYALDLLNGQFIDYCTFISVLKKVSEKILDSNGWPLTAKATTLTTAPSTVWKYGQIYV